MLSTTTAGVSCKERAYRKTRRRYVFIIHDIEPSSFDDVFSAYTQIACRARVVFGRLSVRTRNRLSCGRARKGHRCVRLTFVSRRFAYVGATYPVPNLSFADTETTRDNLPERMSSDHYENNKSNRNKTRVRTKKLTIYVKYKTNCRRNTEVKRTIRVIWK